ncbi:MAG TPA: hypothetical protein VFC24_09000 [Casimicrobiaceae bacterium]|nr:hypothetical protein [Casimicrobiaceae bacterium]
MTPPGERIIDRSDEWFVPRFGPRRFRVLVGLLFLPYTGMVLSFTALGALLAPVIDWERVAALLVIYALALGIGAHALDAIGKGAAKPWGSVFASRTLRWIAGVSLAAAYAIGAWYMQRYAPWLWPIAIAEGFFVLAYNLEWFDGRFHDDAWFAFSWGALPAMAGYMLQTNSLSLAALALAAGTAALSVVEIKASRPYKALRQAARTGGAVDDAHLRTLEAILKSVSLGTIALTLALALARYQTG